MEKCDILYSTKEQHTENDVEWYLKEAHEQVQISGKFYLNY